MKNNFVDSSLCVLLLTVICGCGGTMQLDTAPVTGTVTIDGQPINSGVVMFVPKSGRSSRGEIQPDGTFRLATYGKGDGAILGENRVVVYSISETLGTTSGRALADVPRKYSSPATTDITYEVKAGVENFAKIKLTSTPRQQR